MAQNAAGWITLSFWPSKGEMISFEIDEDALERETAFYVPALRHRDRWRYGTQSRDSMRGLALGSLELELSPRRAHRPRLGDPVIARRVRDMFARESIVELVMPDLPRDDATRGRLLAFPWEYVFSAAYRDGDAAAHAVLVRRMAASMEVPEAPRRPRRGAFARALYVELTPGPLQDMDWTFVEERSIARAFAADAPGREVDRLTDAQQQSFAHLATIRGRAARTSPWLVHIAGFDAAQAYDELHKAGLWRGDRQTGAEIPFVGQVPVYDPTSQQKMAFAPAVELAEAVTAADDKPALVIACLHDSQASLAAEAVSHGAALALGFQDHVDDAVAELFVRELYTGLAKQTFVVAFREALDRAKLMTPSFHGTGIVVYARDSIFGDASSRAPFYPGPVARKGKKAPRPRTTIPHYVIEPHDELNFAMLSNGAPLFREFYVKRYSAASTLSADVEVILHVGEGGYRHQETLDLEPTITDLTRNAQVPMTWLRDRMPSECVRTTLEVAIKYGKSGPPALRQTKVVTLLPPDSWRDDDASRQWLPAFVLPRDPAVREILSRAQRHLDVIKGEPLSGFDGYQAIDETARNPYRGVDAQAEAIWNGFVVDLDLRYVNPPPSYQAAVQRLRSPSGVLRDGRGTCIDLALFYAACLEMVGIWPALFLLEGHCFVGYWRSEDGMYEFLEDALTGGEHDAANPARSRPSINAGWLFEKEYYGAIRKEVHRRRQLVPIEATMLTARASFADAVRAGKENLRSKSEFHSLMDVWAARDQRVTPLPFVEATGIPERVMSSAWSRGAP